MRAGSVLWIAAATVASAALRPIECAPVRQDPRPHAAGVTSPKRIVVDGVVFDSLLGQGTIAGAEVWVKGTSISTMTDEKGGFSLSLPPTSEGYTISATHSSWERFGIDIRPVVVAAGPEERVRINLTSPSPNTLASSLCTPDARVRGAAVVLALDVSTTARTVETPIAWVEWDEFLVSSARTRVHRKRVDAVPLSPTVALMCGIPTEIDVSLRARTGARLLWMRLWPSPDITFLAVDSQFFGRAAASGEVETVDKAGQPVLGASIGWASASTYQRTNADGRATVPRSSLSDSILVVRAIGYTPESVPINRLEPDRTLTLVLQRIADSLPTVNVRAPTVGLGWATGFESRKRLGLGTFLTLGDIERTGVRNTLHLFQRLPGWVVDESRGALLSARCYGAPALYINGSRVPKDAFNLIPLEEVVAVEAYRSNAETPPEFLTLEGCGASVVVWTRAAATGQRPSP
jgi:hypothetical protein